MTGVQTYARTEIQTSDPRAIIVLLYEGAIRFLTQALESARSGQSMDMSQHIVRAQKIIHFLDNALDFNEGADIAVNLSKLYAYMRDALHDANIRSDLDKIEEVIGLIRPLLEAWRQVASDPLAAAALEERQRRPVVVLEPAGEALPEPQAVVVPAPSSPLPPDGYGPIAAARGLSKSAVATNPRPGVAAARAAYGIR